MKGLTASVARSDGRAAKSEPRAERLCENCPAPATTADDTGIPLCEPCRAATAEECSAAPAQGHNRGYEGGYDAGFADGVDQVASDLLPAAKAVADLYMLTAEFSTPPLILRLREAIAACEAAL